VKLHTSLLSDLGRARQNNEDALGEDRALNLLVLADGMGGHQAGEVASQLAVSTILDTQRQSRERTSNSLRRSIEQANLAICEAARSNPDYSGMGTTVVACLANKQRVAIAWVGDSRLYRLRGKELERLTRDHSLLQEMVDHGRYTLEQAQQIVSKNIVTRALGIEAAVDVDTTETSAEPGDLLLLCSDGLTDMLDDGTIRAILLRAGDLDSLARALVADANARGGKDNISVVLARVEKLDGP
jgi:serine/threonine protein phosphatase PrpC